MAPSIKAAPPHQPAVPTQVDVPAIQQDVFAQIDIGSSDFTFGSLALLTSLPAAADFAPGIAKPGFVAAPQGSSPVNRSWFASVPAPPASKDVAVGAVSTATYRAAAALEEASHGVTDATAGTVNSKV